MGRCNNPNHLDHVVNIAAILGVGVVLLGWFGLTLFQYMDKPPLNLTLLQSGGLLLGGVACLWFANVRNKKLTAQGRLGIVDDYCDKALVYLEMLWGVIAIACATLIWTVMIRDGITQEKPLTLKDQGMMVAGLAILAGGGVLVFRQGKKKLRSIKATEGEEQDDVNNETKDA